MRENDPTSKKKRKSGNAENIQIKSNLRRVHTQTYPLPSTCLATLFVLFGEDICSELSVGLANDLIHGMAAIAMDFMTVQIKTDSNLPHIYHTILTLFY